MLFVDHKGDQQWVWLALDIEPREIVGFYIGARDEMAAHQFWKSLPAVYRQCRLADTAFWHAYRAILPQKRHRAVSKKTGQTSYIEQFNNTLRQRVSRVVKTFSPFPNLWKISIGAIWYLIHHYNASLFV